MSSAEENKALVRRYMEAQAKGDLDALAEMLAPNFVDHSLLPGQTPGREGILQGIAEDYDALSNRRTTIEYQATDGDDIVITRFTSRSIHDRGAYLGIMAPTGEERVSTGIVIHRIKGNKIAEEWSEGSGWAQVTQARLEQELRERERIEQDLRVARSIQQASLPKEVPALEGWKLSPFYQPAREVGGDFYDFHLLSDGRLGLVVGDATGKGVPAALVMSSTRSMLRALARASDYSAGEVLEQVNDLLVTDIPPNMFVTCFYAILVRESGRLVYANAGHDLPYLHRSNGEAEELRARGMPLGLMPGMSYEQKETVLEPRDSVLLYSDGLVEAHDPKGEMLGFPRLQRLVTEHNEQRSLVDFLMKELYRFVGEGWEQEDDITLLTLRGSASLS
jgi:ketosteroid isomerase-like protein